MPGVLAAQFLFVQSDEAQVLLRPSGVQGSAKMKEGMTGGGGMINFNFLSNSNFARQKCARVGACLAHPQVPSAMMYSSHLR